MLIHRCCRARFLKRAVSQRQSQSRGSRPPFFLLTPSQLLPNPPTTHTRSLQSQDCAPRSITQTYPNRTVSPSSSLRVPPTHPTPATTPAARSIAPNRPSARRDKQACTASLQRALREFSLRSVHESRSALPAPASRPRPSAQSPAPSASPPRPSRPDPPSDQSLQFPAPAHVALRPRTFAPSQFPSTPHSSWNSARREIRAIPSQAIPTETTKKSARRPSRSTQKGISDFFL